MADQHKLIEHWKAKGLDFSKLFTKPIAAEDTPIYRCEPQDHKIRDILDRKLIAQAKGEAGEILAEARRVGDAQLARAKEETEADRQRRLEDTRKQIEAETARALEQIRNEVAELTLEATSRVVGKVLTSEDHRRLIDDAIGDLDFSALEGERS